ncbi:MobA/MobL family protein [Candidatus Tisiphia endosymbiont of Nemotelus uliginosus]|uniref:MobA/MobL family protein n=1 Tax=Candidatus Tisiphia endosymbiont of Nemotelus uliginosus TaxID=3077926 RepID=UPI0035C9181A
MAIYHCSKSEVQRSKGQNAVAASSYISRSKLQLVTTDSSTGEQLTISYNLSSRKGLSHSIILAPDDAPAWVYNRQELWNKAESSETRKNAETARKLTIALPKELTLQQNIELIEDFAFECLVSHGMIADINIHYDNEDNPHVHIQMTTRRLLRSLENGEVTFGAKGRSWGRREFLYYYRENVANFINLHLEKHGSLDRVSHLSHKARGIDLIPTIHEGAAWYIKDSKLKLINAQILQENVAKIRATPELVFDKLSINKPVFTKEEIAIALSDVLSVDLKIGPAAKQAAAQVDDSFDQQKLQQDLRELSKQLVTENVQEDKEVSGDNIVADTHLLRQKYSYEFMLLFRQLLASDKISLVHPSDLKGRTYICINQKDKVRAEICGNSRRITAPGAT